LNQKSKRQGEAESIFVQGMQEQKGEGYFRACLASETDGSNQPLENALCSTSKVGFFMAAINLCKRLGKSTTHPFPQTPTKWNIAVVNDELVVSMIEHGYMLVEENRDGTFTAHLMGPMGSFLDDSLENGAFLAECVEKGWLNSYEDATSTTGYRALANLLRKLDTYGGAQTLDSMVLEPVVADFFLPVALSQED